MDYQTRMLCDADFRPKLHKTTDKGGRLSVNTTLIREQSARERRTTPECVARAIESMNDAWHVAPLECCTVWEAPSTPAEEFLAQAHTARVSLSDARRGIPCSSPLGNRSRRPPRNSS